MNMYVVGHPAAEQEEKEHIVGAQLTFLTNISADMMLHR